MGNQIDTLTELSSNLIQQEYISLKAEIRDLVAETGTIAKYSIIFTGAYAAFLLKEKDLKVPTFLYFLPTVFSVLMMIRSCIIGVHIGRIGNYIRTVVEPKFNHIEKFKDMGWEKYYQNFQFSGINMSILGVSFTLFWAINLLATLVIGYYLYKRGT